MRRLALFSLTALAACSAPDVPDPILDAGHHEEPSTRFLEAASLRVQPAAFLLSAPGEVRTVTIEALDAEGEPLGAVPAGWFVLGSSDNDVASGAANATITAGSRPGIAQITVVGPNDTRAVVSVVHAIVASGVRLLDDAVVASPVTPVGEPRARIGAQYAFVNGGAPLAAGDRILGREEATIGGEVVSVEPHGEGQRVVFEVTHPARLIEAPLEFELPIEAQALVLEPELSDFTYDPNSGALLPKQKAAAGFLDIECEGGNTDASILRLEAAVDRLRPGLKLDVSLREDHPRVLVQGDLSVELRTSVIAGARMSSKVTCRRNLGAVHLGGVVVPLGFFPLLIEGQVTLGVGFTLSGELGVGPQVTLAQGGVMLDATVRAGFDCPSGTCQWVAETGENSPALTDFRMMEETDATAILDASLDVFAFATTGLSVARLARADLLELRTGARAELRLYPDWRDQLDDRSDRTRLRLRMFSSVGAGSDVEDGLAALGDFLSGWIPLTDVEVEPYEGFKELASLVEGTFKAALNGQGGYDFTLSLTESSWLYQDNVAEVIVVHEQNGEWTAVAHAPGMGLDQYSLTWKPPSALTGPQRFGVTVKTRWPAAWSVEPEKDSIRTVSTCTEGYRLLLRNYHNDYAAMTTYKEIKCGDVLTVPNNARLYVALERDGQIVKVAPYSLDATRVQVGSADHYGPEDVHVGDFTFELRDTTNGVTVRIPVDLTLSNEAYRSVVGSTKTVTSTTSNTTITLSFPAYEQGLLGYSDGTTREFNWSLLGSAFRESPCAAGSHVDAIDFVALPGGYPYPGLTGYINGLLLVAGGGVVTCPDSTFTVH